MHCEICYFIFRKEHFVPFFHFLFLSHFCFKEGRNAQIKMYAYFQYIFLLKKYFFKWLICKLIKFKFNNYNFLIFGYRAYRNILFLNFFIETQRSVDFLLLLRSVSILLTNQLVINQIVKTLQGARFFFYLNSKVGIIFCLCIHSRTKKGISNSVSNR